MEHPSISRRTLVLGAAAGTAAIGALAAAAPAAAAGTAAGDFHESLVFRAGDDGLAVFHVFGLTTTVAGSVLAFAEARLTQHDADPHHLAVRRSRDGGRTWEPLRYVRRSDGVQSLVNPTPLVDRDSGRIFLFHAECFRDAGNTGGSPDSSRLYVVTSDDDGETWSSPTELTHLFDGDPNGQTLHMPGPGHGLQLTDGRLVLQVWHRRAIAFPVADRRYGVTVIVSDDGGATWQAGGGVPLDGAYPLNEARLIERPDGALVVLGRYASGGTHPRIVSVSTDRGATWSPPVLDASARPVNAIDTGIVRLSGLDGDREPSRIVFSRTDSPTRRNMTVSISYDEGMTWPYSRVLTEGPASYSDTVALPGARVGVLYGREHQPGVTTSFSRDVVFATFDLAWLTGGADTGRRGPATRLSFEVEDLPATTSPGLTVVRTADPAASGGHVVEVRHRLRPVPRGDARDHPRRGVRPLRAVPAPGERRRGGARRRRVAGRRPHRHIDGVGALVPDRAGRPGRAGPWPAHRPVHRRRQARRLVRRPLQSRPLGAGPRVM
ncbi:sialidase family protein [Jiangella rhizosphaerae]|uniref:exo-alpha-sialidase n=1 Tax=Jiangella rhizosphaerae TaxID=2293569 RepID=A0A418KPE8_9ACTN|nr:sialidase family protein [Jiangella rhizosphaerae]RIQ21236.1 exo-alpha-sialidase [Jiangella rhizosphaerae]